MPGHAYDVVSELLVDPGLENMASDMARFETELIMQGDVLQRLREIKGTGTYPFSLVGEEARRSFAQLFQQVALSHASGLWENSLLCGLGTSMEWNFFSSSDPIFMAFPNVCYQISHP